MARLQVLVLLLVAIKLAESGTEGRHAQPQAADKPHVVIMLVDDWGWANVGYHRDPPTREVDTPSRKDWN